MTGAPGKLEQVRGHAGSGLTTAWGSGYVVLPGGCAAAAYRRHVRRGPKTRLWSVTMPGIVTGRAAAGYVVKRKDGCRNRYQVQAPVPLPDPTSPDPPSAKSSLSWRVPT